MADFQLKVSADTQEAEKRLREIDKVADSATKDRKLSINLNDVNKSFSDFKKNVEEAGNNIRTFYSISKNIPGIGDKVQQFEQLAKNTASTTKEQFMLGNALKDNAKAGAILSNSFELATNASGRLVSNLAKIGFATFAVKEAVGILQSAWNGFFNNTIGREIKLRETILKTQTILASTNKVFRNGTEITDPYQKIVSLTSAVNKNIDSIRERSIALAGVTSNDVIEVFGIVASQVGQIGGGLKEAEDLAINFAAALGTFGIPLYQARQEIGSILRGDITMDSYLAKSLGITNEDIAKAKTEVGGVIKFLEDRLSAAVAGQRIAAQGFAGVVSNIADLGELIGQNFGRGLLDPLLSGLTAVFESLFRIRQQIFDIASGAGQAIGRAGQLIVGLTAGRTGLGAGDPGKAAAAAADVAQRGFTELETVAQRMVGAISQAIEALRPTVLILVDAFRNLAEAFVAIKVGTFQALASALANIASVVGTLAPSLATVFNLYARFLNTPAVKYFSEVAAVLALLKRVGLDAATQMILFGRFIVSLVIPSVGALGVALAGLVAAIAGIAVAVGKVILVFAGLATAMVGPAAAIPALAVGLKALATELFSVGNQATGAGAKLGAFATGLRGLGGAAKAAAGSILASLGWIAVIQVGIAAVVDAIGRYQRAQEDQKSSARASEALRRLQTTYKDVGDSASSATKSARDFEQAIVDSRYTNIIQQIEDIKNKIKEVDDYLKDNSLLGRILKAPGRSAIIEFQVKRKDDLKKLEAEAAKIEAQRDRQKADENIKVEAQNRVNLEREINDIRRQQEGELFQLRQQYAQKEVDIFRAAGELRIFQMEQANKKLIEGEEGASAAALDALNNYISVRERGELEIESAKKQLVIEVANLERQISDYRLENEKKIAEIRKRAGENDQKIADYQRQSAGQIAAGSGGGAATFGSTGNVNNAPGWVHGHFQTNNGTLTDLISDVIPVLKSLLDKGIPVELSDGTRIQGGKDDAYYRRMLTKSAQQHRHSGDGRSLDLFVPEGTKVPVPLTNVTGNTGRGGITGGLPGTGKSWVGHLAPGAKAGGAGALLPPKLNDFADIGAPAVAKYADALRGVASAMERLRRIQEQLTGAKTAAAFEEIAKAAFKPVGLESYQDKLYELDGVMKSLAQGTYDAFNPERSQIAAEQAAKLLSAQRELDQITAGINARTNLSGREKKAAIDAVRTAHQGFVASLQEEEQVRLRINAITQIADLLRRFEQETAQIERENDAIRLRNRLLIEGVDPALIEQEVARLKRAQQVNDAQRLLNKLTENQVVLQNQLNEARAKGDSKKVAELEKKIKEQEEEIQRLREALKQAQGRADQAKPETPIDQSKNPRDIIQNRIGNLQRELADLTNWGNIAVKAADGIGSAFSEAFRSVITGASTAQEALGTMFQRIGEMFIQMATEMIAKMLVLYLLKSLVGLFGGGGGGGGGGAPFTPPAVVYAAEGAYWQSGFQAFADGGVVDRPTLGLIGEGGEPEYVIPASKMNAAMARYGSGARGASVIPTEGDAYNAQSTGAGGTATLDIRYSVERINNVDYVTAEEFQRGMAAAARQGAKQGEASTLRRLQQSTSTRSRLGIR